MEKVSIVFGGGVLVVKDEKGKKLDVERATVWLIPSNPCPVARIEVDGVGREVPVSSLEISSAQPLGEKPGKRAASDA